MNTVIVKQNDKSLSVTDVGNIKSAHASHHTHQVKLPSYTQIMQT
jgi:hypothetical protein